MAEPRAALRTAFRSLCSAAPEGMALLDARGSVVALNPALGRLAGPEARPGQPAGQWLAAADRPALAALLAGGGAGCMTASPAGGGAARWSLSAEGLPGGGWLLRVAALDAAGGPEARLAAGRLELLGRLACGVAHDLNNMLSAIRYGADAMRAEGMAPAALAELQVIEDAARRGSALIGRLLAFARPGQAAPGVLALDAAVADLAPMLRRLLGPGVRVDLELGAPAARVRLQAVELDQLLLNLAANAGDAMPDGGSLGIATRRGGAGVVLEVRDSGRGIPPEAMARLFEPFFTTRAAEGGTGLGLSTVRSIVDGAGGRVAAESQPGRGSCFRIELPEAGPAEEPAATGEGPVLLVEDEPVLRRLAERVLQRAGHEALLAENAESALALLERAPTPGMLVCDIALPGMDGRALARQLRGRWPWLPVVLASGYGGQREELSAEGFHWLAKPYTPDELMAALAAARPSPGRV